MKKTIAVYGLPEDHSILAGSKLPDNFVLYNADTVTDLLVAGAVCCIVNAEALDETGISILHNYYVDVGEYASEQIIWIGEAPPHKAFSHYDSFAEIIRDLDGILQKAQQRYEIFTMYCGEYAALPTRFIADSLEQEVLYSLHCKYGEDPDPTILKRVRREWTALLEVGAAQELAAVYELTLWLRKHAHPYWIGGNAPSGFVSFLLGITRVNPLPKELGGESLVWQEFCCYGRLPLYEIHLSADLQPRIIEWLKNHWLSKVNHYEWKVLQPYEPRYIRRGNMYFYFDIDDDSTPMNCEMPTLCREDIFFYLKKCGFIDKDAFRGMNLVRKGKGFPVITAEMRKADDNWILKECENVRWLPSRAQILEQKLFLQQSQKEIKFQLQLRNIVEN